MILSPTILYRRGENNKSKPPRASVDGFTFIIQQKIALIPSTTVNYNEIIVAIIFPFSLFYP